jgi:hypothetical protein
MPGYELFLFILYLFSGKLIDNNAQVVFIHRNVPGVLRRGNV